MSVIMRNFFSINSSMRWPCLLILTTLHLLPLVQSYPGRQLDLIGQNINGTTYPLNDILCPILNLIRPDTSNRLKFIMDINKRGNVSIPLALTLAIPIITAQKGILASLTRRGPDITRLDEVPIFSHDTLFQLRMEGVKKQLEEKADVNGMVTLKDMVAVKRWVSDETRKRLTLASRLETVFLFNLAGGDISDTVKTETVLNILIGSPPLERFGHNSIPLVVKGLLVN